MVSIGLKCGILCISAAALVRVSAAPDPCKLVTVAEIQGVVGVPFAATPESMNDDPFFYCRYKSVAPGHMLEITVREIEQADFEKGMKILRHGLPVGPGMGPDAYTQYLGSGNLYVWKKGSELTFHLEDQSGNTSPEEREALQEKLAKLALSRL